jgi:hypothetical protein
LDKTSPIVKNNLENCQGLLAWEMRRMGNSEDIDLNLKALEIIQSKGKI